jgi:hypothetical protein
MTNCTRQEKKGIRSKEGLCEKRQKMMHNLVEKENAHTQDTGNLENLALE